MMVKQKYSLKDFRHKNEQKWPQDPTNDFSIIPSWNKEFACLVGLEEVVQFRLERLDKTEYTVPNKRRRMGRQKKFPIPAVVPPALLKDPNTCTKCNTDVSCAWNCDMSSSLFCHSCFKYSWRKDHWLIVPTETIIKSISDNSSITSTNHAMVNEPQSMDEAVFSLQPSSFSIPQESDQQITKNSVSSSSNCYPDSPFYSSSDFSSSPPGYFCDTSSHLPSSFSSDYDCSCIYCASSSCASSHCDSISSLYLPSSSDFNSSSSMSPSPPCSPPNNSTKKVKMPYWMETPVAKALLKDDKAKQKSRKDKDEKSHCKEEKTVVLKVPSLSNQHILFKTQSVVPDLKPSTSSLVSIGDQQLQTRMLTPNLQKTTIAEKCKKLTLKDGLESVGHGNLQKVNTNVSSGYDCCTTSGSSTYASDSVKSKSTFCYLPRTWSAVSGNIRHQASGSIPRCSQESIIGTNAQHQASQAHSSFPQISNCIVHQPGKGQTLEEGEVGGTFKSED